MKYKITHINDSDGWIFISAPGSFEEPDVFVEMVKMIADSVRGTITSVGDTQYRISNIPYDLVFQWDDLFGIVVINETPENKDSVLAFLENYNIK